MMFWKLILGYVLVSLACEARLTVGGFSNNLGLIKVRHFDEGPFEMKMDETKNVTIVIEIYANRSSLVDIKIAWKARTTLPQFDILKFRPYETVISNFESPTETVHIELTADYIGRAILQPDIITVTELQNHKFTTRRIDVSEAGEIRVRVTKDQGIWGRIFIIGVVLLMITIYANLGAQIDVDNMKQILSRPKTISIGFIICTLTMPIVSWLIFSQLLPNQVFYLIGSYVFACGPAAMASTPWTELLGGDKELSIGLQLMSTIIATLTMPLLLQLTELFNGNDELHHIDVPYGSLIELSSVLLVSLFLGYTFIGLKPRFKKISAKIYRPLIFIILLLIIISSSIIYRHIYRMFDWTITLGSALVVLNTLIFSSALGYLINFNKRHALTIGISSIYKNEGIAFTVLLIAYKQPDNYVAYIPCLTQILITSFSFVLIRCVIHTMQAIRRRGQPEPIQTEAPKNSETNEPNVLSNGDSSRKVEMEPTGAKHDEETDEFIALDVTNDIQQGGEMAGIKHETKPEQQSINITNTK